MANDLTLVVNLTWLADDHEKNYHFIRRKMRRQTIQLNVRILNAAAADCFTWPA